MIDGGGIPGPAWTPEMRSMMEKVLPRDVTALVKSLIPMMASQAFIFMGRVDNPLQGGKTRDLVQARLAVDCATALLEKVEPVLPPDDKMHLRQLVTELQTQFVQAHSEGA